MIAADNGLRAPDFVRLSARATTRVLESELNRAIATLRDRARAVETQLSEFGVDRLLKADAFHFFRRLVNLNRATADATCRCHIR